MRQRRFTPGMIQASDNLQKGRYGRPQSGKKELHCTYNFNEYIILTRCAQYYKFLRLLFRVYFLQVMMVLCNIQWCMEIRI